MKKEITTPPTKQSYVEPVGFKGSKGEWLPIKSSTGFFIKTNYGKTVCERHSSELGVITSGADHDAQLLAYSKDIAKALQDMIERDKEYNHLLSIGQPLGNDDLDNWYNAIENAKQVLKEAGLTNE